MNKVGFKFWYLDQTVWPVEDNIIRRILENRGFDLLFDPTALKIYNRLYDEWYQFKDKNIRDLDIYMYGFFFSFDKYKSFFYFLRKISDIRKIIMQVEIIMVIYKVM